MAPTREGLSFEELTDDDVLLLSKSVYLSGVWGSLFGGPDIDDVGGHIEMEMCLDAIFDALKDHHLPFISAVGHHLREKKEYENASSYFMDVVDQFGRFGQQKFYDSDDGEVFIEEFDALTERLDEQSRGAIRMLVWDGSGAISKALENNLSEADKDRLSKEREKAQWWPREGPSFEELTDEDILVLSKDILIFGVWSGLDRGPARTNQQVKDAMLRCLEPGFAVMAADEHPFFSAVGRQLREHPAFLQALEGVSAWRDEFDRLDPEFLSSVEGQGFLASRKAVYAQVFNRWEANHWASYAVRVHDSAENAPPPTKPWWKFW